MIGDKRNFPAALVVPELRERSRSGRASKGVAFASREELIAAPEVVALYDLTVKELTGHLAQFERIKKIALLPARVLASRRASSPRS